MHSHHVGSETLEKDTDASSAETLFCKTPGASSISVSQGCSPNGSSTADARVPRVRTPDATCLPFLTLPLSSSTSSSSSSSPSSSSSSSSSASSSSASSSSSSFSPRSSSSSSSPKPSSSSSPSGSSSSSSSSSSSNTSSAPEASLSESSPLSSRPVASLSDSEAPLRLFGRVLAAESESPAFLSKAAVRRNLELRLTSGARRPRFGSGDFLGTLAPGNRAWRALPVDAEGGCWRRFFWPRLAGVFRFFEEAEALDPPGFEVERFESTWTHIVRR
mmetsp:Transcript_26253/g.37371  ORF Transcript_26253/g.37371 Transcript_26253/m.37371 type:complete len:275 (-) Transcript_26253:5703-6527(-)